MTVGIAAMAEKGRAMVLCADRQTTAGDMRHEGRIAKKREIGYGWRFLYEDNATRADQLRDDIQDALAKSPYDWTADGFQMTEREMTAQVQAAFLALRDRTIKAGILAEAKEFDLGVLLVGFNESNEAAGLRFFESGDHETIRDVGYGVIGSGQDVADAALANYGIPYDDPLDRVLWKVYEAKRRADRLITSVGSTTDLWIMTDHEKRQGEPTAPREEDARAIRVPQRITEVLGKHFEWVSNSPPWQRSDPPPTYEWAGVTGYATAIMQGQILL